MTPRVASPRDAAAIAALEAVAAAAPWSEAQVRSSLELPTTRAWLIEGVGHLLVGADEVLTVAVHPDHRREGHAARLLAEAEAWWRGQGVPEAFLEVRADNRGALALYRARGWRPAGRRPGYYRDGCDALILRWTP